MGHDKSIGATNAAEHGDHKDPHLNSDTLPDFGLLGTIGATNSLKRNTSVFTEFVGSNSAANGRASANKRALVKRCV